MPNGKTKPLRNTRLITMSGRWLLILLLIFALVIPVTYAGAPGDLVIPRKEGVGSEEFMPPSIFPHWVHRIRYRCDACHDELFEMQLGATPVTMELIQAGKACGACHDGTTSFNSGFENCNRCHRQAAD